MAQIEVVVPAAREDVWSVLADPWSYSRWVVGAKAVRGVDGRWPEPGSRFHHTVGFGPLTLHDETRCVLAEAPRLLVLDARARPLGRASVEVRLASVEGGARISIEEHVVSPTILALLDPLLVPFIAARNAESLRRLGELAAGAPARTT
jgi:uncharacterized protein YndB with AHSA1/START domain